jgi:dihydrofolate reductase
MSIWRGSLRIATESRRKEPERMRMLRVIEFMSLDGVIQAPGAPDEDTEGGFEHGGWQREYVDDVLGATAAEGMAATDAYLFGRKTYEAMARYWPTVSDDDPYARHLNRLPKYVASRTLRRVEWKGSTLIEGDVSDAVAVLKRQPGGSIAVLGSGELVRALLAHELIDELFLVVFPILLGGGKRLFGAADHPTKLSLVNSKPTGTGGVMLTYRRL